MVGNEQRDSQFAPYSLGAWFGATLMAWIKEVPLRRHAVIVLGCTIVAVVAWLANVSLLLSLLSIVLIMKLFYQFELHFGIRASSPLSVIGANTIAIYTTHRILVELFSLTLIPKINHATACIRGAGPATGVSVRLYAAVHPVCLLVRKISQNRGRSALFPALFIARLALTPTRFCPIWGRINCL